MYATKCAKSYANPRMTRIAIETNAIVVFLVSFLPAFSTVKALAHKKKRLKSFLKTFPYLLFREYARTQVFVLYTVFIKVIS